MIDGTSRVGTATALCLMLCACGAGDEPANVVTRQPTPMATPQPVTPAPAPAPPTNAEADIRAMLDRIYAPYASPDAPGSDLAQYMEPQLAAAMRSRQGGMDADPFLDAQSYQPFRPVYGLIRVAGATADTDVQVVSDGRRTIHFTFVRTPAGWRIADIRGARSGSLRVHFGLTPLS